MNTMDQIKVRYGEEGKLVPIQEFLKVENLSGITKKIQDSLNDLYQLNGRSDPPVFHFPDFPEDKPLIVDCTTPTDDDCTAHYRRGEHIVEFVRDLHDNPHLDGSSFTETLAHEFSHAEMDVPEIQNIPINGLQYNQKELIDEALAFAKGKLVRRMLAGGINYTSENEKIHAVESEIERLKTSVFYRNRWAEYSPIKEGDKPLTSIPEAFHLSNNLLSSIWTFPKVALKPENKTIKEIRETLGEIYEYFLNPDNKNRAVSADKLFERLLFNENVSSDTVKQDLEVIGFLLTLSDDKGKKLLPENSLTNKFFEKGCWEGIEDSKLLQLAELVTDSKGKRIFPENFSQKAKGMTISEFSDYFNHYLDTLTPDVAEDIQPKISDKKEPKSMTNRLRAHAHKNGPGVKKGKTITSATLIKNAHQTGG